MARGAYTGLTHNSRVKESDMSDKVQNIIDGAQYHMRSIQRQTYAGPAATWCSVQFCDGVSSSAFDGGTAAASSGYS